MRVHHIHPCDPLTKIGLVAPQNHLVISLLHLLHGVVTWWYSEQVRSNHHTAEQCGDRYAHLPRTTCLVGWQSRHSRSSIHLADLTERRELPAMGRLRRDWVTTGETCWVMRLW